MVKLTVQPKIDILKNFFKNKGKIIPKQREVFAVGTGVYVGEMLVYMKKDNENYYFLSIPKNINRVVPIDRFNFAMEHRIAEFAHTLPRDIYKICSKQFEYNLKNTGKATVKDK